MLMTMLAPSQAPVDEGKVKLSTVEYDDDTFKLPAGYHW